MVDSMECTKCLTQVFYDNHIVVVFVLFIFIIGKSFGTEDIFKLIEKILRLTFTAVFSIVDKGDALTLAHFVEIGC